MFGEPGFRYPTNQPAAKNEQIPQQEQESEHIEFEGENYRVDRPAILRPSDMGRNDRIFISTESGNRYMIRWSKSAQSFKVYNEKADNFKTGELLHNAYQGDKTVAGVGSSLDVTIVTDPVKNLGKRWQSTAVTGIEIRRDIDAAIENTPPQVGFQGMAKAMIDETNGRGN